MGQICKTSVCEAPRTRPLQQAHSRRSVNAVSRAELQLCSTPPLEGSSSGSVLGILEAWMLFSQDTNKAECSPPRLRARVQVPQDQASALMPPLADLPHGGCPEHGQVPEPVHRHLLLQRGHPVLEHQHLQAHPQFQRLSEPLALATQEGMVSRNMLSSSRSLSCGPEPCRAGGGSGRWKGVMATCSEGVWELGR